MADIQNPYKSPESTIAPNRSGAKAKRQRSRFWIVSTHVLTTAVAIPFVMGLVAIAAVARGNLQGNQAFLATLAFQAVGYVGGTYYSLSYLRKATAMTESKGMHESLGCDLWNPGPAEPPIEPRYVDDYFDREIEPAGHRAEPRLEPRDVERNQSASRGVLGRLLHRHFLGLRKNHRERLRRHGTDSERNNARRRGINDHYRS